MNLLKMGGICDILQMSAQRCMKVPTHFEPDGVENLSVSLDLEIGKRHLPSKLTSTPAGKCLMGSHLQQDKGTPDIQQPWHTPHLPV